MGWKETEHGLKIQFDRVVIENGTHLSVFRNHAWWNEFDNVINGAPLLLLNGKKISVLEEKTLPEFRKADMQERLFAKTPQIISNLLFSMAAIEKQMPLDLSQEPLSMSSAIFF